MLLPVVSRPVDHGPVNRYDRGRPNEPQFTSQQVLRVGQGTIIKHESSRTDAVSLRERVSQRSRRAQVAERLQPAVFPILNTGQAGYGA
ncbi:uncharacterized protein TRIVIDRAFT_224021 [Trichoderma virens Gv29-8]|uniref:Uncharacterized protein n=1 Tax=Hypocrea virens (strain Gv29-8 / FGSC 10586) TaxID=413071 RepID=G9MYX3_HYPVG|nr:uncharacterized protein TRIVIDRAFT_224021 [Trichoderma virens Gv29-8]EHK20302.1 hypothetical protein TRIVIDRAFT_224021 [Trichoderma virens Gv29-8]UKZ46963.1 hypothetical protein TrVGV298_001174 [Trichoderma virens]